MTAMDFATGDQLLDDMWPVAAELVMSVRAWDPHAVAALVEPLDVLHTRALLVVLAALVPDDAPMGDLAAWSHTDPTVPLTAEDQLPIGAPSRGEKRCPKCRRVLPLVLFRRDCTLRDGRTTRCRMCLSTGLSVPAKAKAGGRGKAGEVAA